MLNLAIVLTHNKGDAENFNQIEFFKSITEIKVESHPESTDPYGNIFPAFNTYHQIIKGLLIPHEIKIYQIIPFGVTPPQNRGDINSGGMVYYQKGDEDKVGDHSRFFNWGIKRSTDNGAEITIHVDDYKSFTVDDIPFILNTLADPLDKTDFVEQPSAKFTTVRILKTVGQVTENKPLSEAIGDYKTKIVSKGFINGS